ncbi:MAG: twin-arginine translocase TatA/TatE family subunit [Anaerolineales bacterium]|nr:twin-arginine translocase TatA/TatE family subunit [Anaerolineales bacterium]
MIGHLGLPELLIVLVLVILVFGIGRISKIAGELGKGISEFRKGLSGNTSDKKEDENKDES